MSQHCYSTKYQNKPVTVMLGWDRPLQHFYMIVEADVDMEAEESDEDDYDGEYIYSNLNERYPARLTLDYFREKLQELGIAVPESMFEQAVLDQRLDVVNRRAWHSEDGTFREA